MTTKQVTSKQHIIFEYENKYIENSLFLCDSSVICKNDNYKIIHKKLNTDGEQFDIFLTYISNEKDEYGNPKLVRSYIYKNNKEYDIIINFKLYARLSINDTCYDIIAICKISENIFV